MIPEFPTAARRSAALCLVLVAAGCTVFKNNVEAQAVVNQRVVGMQVGEFFDRFGPWKLRDPQLDGSTEYSWISPITSTPNSGFYGLDDRTCTMKLVTSKDGRIVAATILQDMPGRTSTSRCLEMFKAA